MFVEYKGGKCLLCGYCKYLGALEFHHLDRSKKEFRLSRMKTPKLTDKAKAELDKCVLLCAVCHREVEANISNLPI